MSYYKTVIDGYILMIGEGLGETVIEESEYNEIMSIIHNKPAPRDGYDYILKTDLTWEEYELPPVPEYEPSVEDKAEAYDIITGVSE